MSDLAAAQRALRATFGFEAFRPGQDEIVAAMLDRRDVLALGLGCLEHVLEQMLARPHHQIGVRLGGDGDRLAGWWLDLGGGRDQVEQRRRRRGLDVAVGAGPGCGGGGAGGPARRASVAAADGVRPGDRGPSGAAGRCS